MPASFSAIMHKAIGTTPQHGVPAEPWLLWPIVCYVATLAKGRRDVAKKNLLLIRITTFLSGELSTGTHKYLALMCGSVDKSVNTSTVQSTGSCDQEVLAQTPIVKLCQHSAALYTMRSPHVLDSGRSESKSAFTVQIHTSLYAVLALRHSCSSSEAPDPAAERKRLVVRGAIHAQQLHPRWRYHDFCNLLECTRSKLT
jgi:hypothetical protein